MKAPVVVFAVGNPSRGDDAAARESGHRQRHRNQLLGLFVQRARCAGRLAQRMEGLQGVRNLAAQLAQLGGNATGDFGVGSVHCLLLKSLNQNRLQPLRSERKQLSKS